MREEANAAVVVLTMEAENPFGYGRIVRDDGGRCIRPLLNRRTARPSRLKSLNAILAFIALILNFYSLHWKKFLPIMRKENIT